MTAGRPYLSRSHSHPAAEPPGDEPGRRHYRAPRECPVCNERLQVTQLGCDACGTGISGDFESCDFCALDPGDLDVLRVFLTSRGNIKELERHLGVSYPTARARFDDMVRKLGLLTGPEAEPDPVAAATPERGAAAPATDADPRLSTLRSLANGELDLEQARRLITGETGPRTPSPTG